MGFNKIALVVSTFAVVVLAQAATAFALPPTICTSGYPKKGYDVGLLIGASITRQAWNGTNQDPTQVEAFMATVLAKVNAAIDGLPTNASDYVKCRAAGLLQGVSNEFDEIDEEVAGVCMIDGQMWGVVMADFYCALSNALNGLGVAGLLPDPPNGLCGDNFELACEASFASFANDDANSCDRFTVAPFAAVFAETQANSCIF